MSNTDKELHNGQPTIKIDISFKHVDLVKQWGDSFQDKWMITLKYDNRETYIDYYQGIGHRKPKLVSAGGSPRDYDYYIKSFRNFKQSEGYKKEIESCSLPTTPSYDDIIYCLLSDVDMDYSDKWVFIEEFGYNENPREGERVYNACLDQKEKIKKLLGKDFSEWLTTEQERLEDF